MAHYIRDLSFVSEAHVSKWFLMFSNPFGGRNSRF